MGSEHLNRTAPVVVASILAALVAIVIGGWTLLGHDGEGVLVVTPDDPTDTGQDGTVQKRASGTSTDTVDPAPRASELTRPVGGQVPVEGAVRYVSGGHPFYCSFSLGAIGEPDAHVDCREGRFSVTLGVAEDYVVSDVRIEGEDIVSAAPPRVTRVGPLMSVTLFDPEFVMLTLIDELSRKPIAIASAYRDARPGGSDIDAVSPRRLPSAETRGGTPVRSDGLGRLRLPRTSGPMRWWVVAERYSWKPIYLPDVVGSAMTVTMMAGGSIAVSVPSLRDLNDAMIMMSDSSGRVLGGTPILGKEGNVLLEGIPIGRVKVEVSHRASAGARASYGREEATIFEGGGIGSRRHVAR